MHRVYQAFSRHLLMCSSHRLRYIRKENAVAISDMSVLSFRLDALHSSTTQSSITTKEITYIWVETGLGLVFSAFRVKLFS